MEGQNFMIEYRSADVMASSGDPVAEGIVASLARPGGNATGFHTLAPPELGARAHVSAVPAAASGLRHSVIGKES